MKDILLKEPRVVSGISPHRGPESSMEKYESSLEKYNREILPYCNLLPVDLEELEIITSPHLWLHGTKMPSGIIIKKLPDSRWYDITKALESKVQMEIPTVEETGDLTSLEGIDPRDLQLGNVICALSADRHLGDLNGIPGGGWYCEPHAYAWEVIDVPQKYPSPTEFKLTSVRTVEVNHPLFCNILKYINNQGYIQNPLIAKGLHIQFMSLSGPGTPNTSAIQQLCLFKDMNGFYEAMQQRKDMKHSLSKPHNRILSP